MQGVVDTKNFTRRKAPVLVYKELAQAVLPGWEISLVFVGETRATNLNKALRGKDYAPNVLSYVLDEKTKSGEIIICLTVAEHQAPSYELSYKNFVGLLYIHGLLHIKGLDHSDKMEKREQELMQKFVLAKVTP